MKEICASILGLCATVDYKDSIFFNGIRYNKTRSRNGSIKTVPVLEKICKDVTDDFGNKYSKIGIGGLFWLYKHNPHIKLKINKLHPPRGPITGELLIPENMEKSPKWRVNGIDRWYFFESLALCFAHCNGMVKLPTGGGKCLGYGTPVVMYDGTLKEVQNVRNGDLLMGPDSAPRVVTKVTTGRSKLYRITPKKGDPFVCNEDHILSLMITSGAKDKRYPDKSVHNISVKDYILQTKTYKHITKLYKTSIELQHRDVEFDPYMVGLHLGRDKKRYIPSHYLYNSKEVRFKLLAGLIDSDGSLSCNSYDFMCKDKSFAEQVTYLSRSLGLSCRMSKCEKRVKSTNFKGTYYRLHISGDTSNIPCKVKSKQAGARRIKKNNLMCGFEVEELGVGDHYGFCLDKDHLFLLGDFTVTHNTEIELTLAHNQRNYIGTGIIIVPTLSIKEQFIKRSEKYEIPNVVDYSEIRSEDNILDNLIVITTPKVLLNDIDNKSNKLFTKIKWIIADECHHAGCSTWYDIFMHLPNAIRSHGFSALPINNSTDWSNRFEDLDIDDARTIAVMGSVIYQKNAKDLKDFLNTPYLINVPYYWLEQYDGNDPHEIRKLVTSNKDRNEFLSNIIKFLIKENYKSITFVTEKEHGKSILTLTDSDKSVAWFGQGKFITTDDRKMTSEDCRGRFGTDLLNIIATSHAIEGLDMDDPINCLLVHEERSMRRTLQRVGRVIRPDLKPTVIINVVDIGVGVLKNQSECRSNNIIDEFDCIAYNILNISELDSVMSKIEKDYSGS